MKVSMGSLQVSSLSILFKLEKPPVEHFEGFIFLPKEGGKPKNFLELLIGNSSSRTKNIPPLDQQKLVHRWLEECLQ
jgi:hypothetical protein